MKRLTKCLSLILVLAMLTLGLMGCGVEVTTESAPSDTETTAYAEDYASDDYDTEHAEIESAGDSQSENSDTSMTDDSDSGSDDSAVAEASDASDTDLYLDPDGSYDSKEDVALYLYLYNELPSNYITKKEAQNLGWSGGSLEAYAEGKCIGGSRFGNYEGILPEGDYHECDIDTLGASSRGAKRIVYSEDGDIYYTGDHYETFTLLYTADGPVTEEIVYPQ